MRFWGNFSFPKSIFETLNPPGKKQQHWTPGKFFFGCPEGEHANTITELDTSTEHVHFYRCCVFFHFFVFFFCVLFSVKMTDLENPVQKNGFYQYIQKILGIKKDETPEILGKKPLFPSRKWSNRKMALFLVLLL